VSFEYWVGDSIAINYSHIFHLCVSDVSLCFSFRSNYLLNSSV